MRLWHLLESLKPLLGQPAFKFATKCAEVVKTVHIGSARSKVGVERLVKNAHKIMDADKQPLFNLSRFDKPKEK